MKSYLITGLSLICLVTYSQNSISEKNKWNFPIIQTDTAIDIYYGNKIIDPYRNLENFDDSLVKDWYKKQKQFYDSVIFNISNRDSIEREIEIYKKQRIMWSEIPRSIGDKLFFCRYSYMTKVISLNYMNTISGTIMELFSSDSLNKADSVEYDITYYEPSCDGSFIVFALSHDEAEDPYMRVLDVKNRRLLPDIIKHVTSGNPQWLPDNSGFIYQKYIRKRNAEGNRHSEKSIRIHKLGSNSENDKEIFSKTVSLQVEWPDIDYPLVFLSQNKEIVLASIHRGTEKHPAVYYVTLDEFLSRSPEIMNWQQIFTSQDLVTYYYLIGEQLYYLSFKDNCKGQLLKLNIYKPNKKEILFEGKENVLKGMVFNQDAIFIKSYYKNSYRLNKIDLDNEKVSTINLPFDGSVYIQPSFKVSRLYQNSNKLFFKYQSWNRDQCIMYYDPDSNRVIMTELMMHGNSSYVENANIELVEVPSHDSTLVPLTIFYNADLELNGRNPLIIEAYGCYGYTYSPNYIAARKAWLKRGGIFAIAHVRGGGEKGTEWYKAGYKATKSNSWKDLISCSEYLIKKGFTSPSKLAVTGTSCGGIAVGRALTERSDLFKAAVISVGRLNTLRHETEYSNASVAEYGTIKDSLEFQYLYEMDVFHHINPTFKYPSILFSAGMSDPRVSPWQSGKAVASFQTLDTSDNIVLFNITPKGHRRFSENAESFSFLLWQLGHPDFKLNYSEYLIKTKK